MDSGKLHRLVATIFEQTEIGKLTWAATITSTVFQLDFRGYSVQIASYEVGEGAWCEFRILNEEGELLEEVSGAELDSTREPHDEVSYRKALMRLFEMARRQALGTEKAIKSIFDQLGGDPEDEIPF